MNAKKSGNSQKQLRQKAEAILRSSKPENEASAGADKLLQELQVHQIELEMQNKELGLIKLALEESQAHYLDLYDFAPVGYLTLNSHDCVTECNLTASIMLGVQHKHLLNHRFVMLIDHEYKDLWHQQLQKAKQAHDKYSFELPFGHRNGVLTYFHVDSKVLREKSELAALRISLSDITEQKITENCLRETEKQLSIEQNKLRDKMEETFRLQVAAQTAVSIAHEINQPLIALSYFADVAESMVSSGHYDPEKLAEILKICSKQALRAGKAIPQLLSSLIASENAHLMTQDVNEIVRRAIRFVKANAGINCKFLSNLAVDLPLVNCNGMQIEKVLINMLNNSLDAMRENEQNDDGIIVSTSIFAKDPGMIQVTVSDHGPRVTEPNMLKKMFEAFYTTKPGSLGMGLAVSRAFVNAQGGEMWAEENSINGMSVHFTLPIDILKNS